MFSRVAMVKWSRVGIVGLSGVVMVNGLCPLLIQLSKNSSRKSIQFWDTFVFSSHQNSRIALESR